MSEYQDPTYTEAYSPGASAHGEEVAYGDEGPAYGDHGPYNADAAYNDAGAATYGAEYEQYDQYDPYADPNLLYEEGDDPFPDEAETVVPAAGKAKKAAKKAPGGKKASLNAKSIGLAAAGMVLLGSLGLGGYFLFVAPPAEGDPAAAAGPSFDLSSLIEMIPFMGSKDTADTIAANQVNAVSVKQAIEAYVKEHGRLPGTSAAIEAQMEKLGLELRSPYDAGMMVPIDLGETPSGPAAIAYSPQGERFTLRVGDSSGKPMKVEGAEWSLLGGPGSASKPATSTQASKPAAGAKPAPANQKPSQPSTTTAVAGAAGVAPDDLPPDAPVAPDDMPPTAPRAQGTGGQSAPAAPNAPTAPAAAQAAPAAAPVRPAATPMPPLAVLRKRNQDFDRLRNQGIALLYEKRTSEAMAVFQKALVLKPNDPTVRSWLETIQGVVDKHTFEESQRLRKDRAELLQRARIVAPPPAQVTEPRRRENEAMRLLDELKEDGAPALAPPRLDN